eukprot:11390595-Ditylum_brightwellii.AAC.1
MCMSVGGARMGEPGSGARTQLVPDFKLKIAEIKWRMGNNNGVGIPMCCQQWAIPKVLNVPCMEKIRDIARKICTGTGVALNISRYIQSIAKWT